MLLALILAATPPSSAYVEIRNQGVSKGNARVINCTGSLSCSVDAGANFATFSVTGSSGDGGLVPGVIDGGACASGQYAHAIDIHGAPTCSAVGYSQLSGSPLAGGSNPQVQYNNSGALGGMTNVTSDGTHLNFTGETAHPSAPGAGALRYDWTPDAGLFQFPFSSDSYLGPAIPLGVLDAFTEGQNGTNWLWQCTRVAGNASAITVGTQNPGNTNWNSAGPAWSNSSVLGRIFWSSGSTTTTATTGQALIQPQFSEWRGNTDGAGGFVFWTRIALHTTGPHIRLFFGLQTGTSNFANVEPSSLSDTAYFGCDNGESTLHICSNDNSGSATCSDLGANFPTQTNDAVYDFWLAAAPNGSEIAYYVRRLDSAAVATGRLTSDIPRNSVQFRWLDQLGPADGGLSLVGYFHGACIASNM